MRFRFVHAADLHLDTPVEGVRRAEPFVEAALRDASLEAFDALVALAIARDAAFVLLAGDLYDGAERGVRAQLTFRRGLERLSRAGIATVMVYGNHDPHRDDWSAIRAWPPDVTVAGSDEVTSVGVVRDGRLLATVHGLSCPAPHVEENLARRFARTDAPGPQIGLLHADVGGASPEGPSSPCTLDDLRAAGLDYWALGHAHGRAILSAPAPWVVYPGTLQGRGPAAGERGAKGAFVVEVDGGLLARPEFVPLDRVRFLALELDVSGVPDLAGLAQALAEQARALLDAAQDRSLVVQARITGSGAVADDLRAPGALAGVLDELRASVPPADGGPFLWWDHLADTTRPSRDRDALRQRGDLRGAVLAFAEELASDPERLRRFADRHLAALPPEALAQVRALPDPASAQRLERAVDLALDALLADGR